MAQKHVPAHVNEATEPVDNIGGVLSAVMIGALVVALNFITVPNLQTFAVGLLVVAAIGVVLFVIRQKRAANPLYDLKIASRSTFWVAAVAGIIVFGSLMGVAFINQQYLQNVLGYNTLQAGAAILPAVVFMVLVAPRSAKLVQERGSRFTLLLGQVILGLAFVGMLLLWGEGTNYLFVAIPLALMGIGVGLAGTPSSNSLTGSVPVRRVGMASGTADLQRDLGGALMTSIFGALLTAGYAAADGHRHHRLRAGRDRHDPERAPALLRQRGGPRGAVPGVRRPDHGRGPSRRSSTATSYAYLAGLGAVLIGVGPDVLPVPQEGRRAADCGRSSTPRTRRRPPATGRSRRIRPPLRRSRPDTDPRTGDRAVSKTDKPGRAGSIGNIIGGFVAGLYSVPEGIGYASLAGLNPMLGIYSGMMPVAVAATATGSVLLMSTLTSAIALTMGGILDSTGYTGTQINQAVFTMALLAGLMMFVLGVLKLGKAVNYVSNAVMTGFVMGVAILIMVGKFDNIFGYDPTTYSNKVVKAIDIVLHPGDWDYTTTVVGIGTIVAAFALKRIPKLERYALVLVVFLGTIIVWVLDIDTLLISDEATIPTGLAALPIPAGAVRPARPVDGADAAPRLGFRRAGCPGAGRRHPTGVPEPGRVTVERIARLPGPGPGQRRRCVLPVDPHRRLVVTDRGQR